MDHLNDKYTGSGVSDGINPDKNNRIDVVSSSELYEPHGNDIAGELHDILGMEYIQERVRQLLRNYDSEKIYEISPLNREGNTSYTEDKARLVLCLRKKEANDQGEYELHDMNTLMFVVLHELSHMMNDKYGHPDGFWVLFKFMLLNAIEAGIYQPVDYRIHPVTYCGLLLSYNPVYDTRI